MKAATRRWISKTAWKRHTTSLRWGALNVRTLHSTIDNKNGELEITGAAPDKPFNLCKLFADHNFSLMAQSETRWKGEGTIQVGEYTIIYSGLPTEAPVSLQGVAVALNPSMRAAWTRAGCVVETVGSRLLRIQLLLGKRTFHVISVYAPTFRATDADKEEFYNNLKMLCGKCKAGEELVVLGDFNARVGRRETAGKMDHEDQAMDTIRGRFGNPQLNDNGRLLLDFCRGYGRHPLRVMSTYFQHKVYETWQHI